MLVEPKPEELWIRVHAGVIVFADINDAVFFEIPVEAAKHLATFLNAAAEIDPQPRHEMLLTMACTIYPLPEEPQP